MMKKASVFLKKGWPANSGIAVFFDEIEILLPQLREDPVRGACFVKAIKVQARCPAVKKVPALFYGKPDPSF